MDAKPADRAPHFAAFWALLATFCFTTNDTLMKFLSGDYSLYQLVFIRTVVGMTFVLCILVPLTGNYRMLRTKRLKLHIIRGLAVVFANLSFFLGLAVLPLAEAVAIFFISPLLIAIFSVIFLGETVGPRRWAAIAMGLVGVLIVLRPGTEAFQIAASLPLAAAFGYATLHILTRHMGTTENATSMTFYIQITFLFVAGSAGLAFGDGRYETFDHPSLEFLFRSWVWPTGTDWPLTAALGICAAIGGFSISEAYRRSEAAFVAPFEYVAMPLSVFWGLLIFAEWPDTTAWLGITLVMVSGLVLIWREAIAGRVKRRAQPL